MVGLPLESSISRPVTVTIVESDIYTVNHFLQIRANIYLISTLKLDKILEQTTLTYSLNSYYDAS